MLGEGSNVVQAVIEKIGRNLHNLKNHPLEIIKSWILEHFEHAHIDTEGKPFFNSFDRLSPVVTTKQCFDDLLTPSDHVSRSRNDTYYVDDTHVLRSHMTAHQTTLLRAGHRRFLFSGDVYRRDSVDSCHYFCFHQMDGVRVFSWEELGATCHEEAVSKVLEDLKSTLKGMVAAVFGNVEMRWVDSFFPFTEPSLELEILFNGNWLEVLGCGVMRQKILQNGGLREHTGWAFGLGLERLAMILFDIPDIRLFWCRDDRFLRQFQDVRDQRSQRPKFVPFSKYPICYKDVAFWHKDGFHDNDIAEIVREMAGDVAEDVKLLSNFTHPKTGRMSRCFRISYRSMERTLVNQEVDDIQARVCQELVRKLDVELR